MFSLFLTRNFFATLSRSQNDLSKFASEKEKIRFNNANNDKERGRKRDHERLRK